MGARFVWFGGIFAVIFLLVCAMTDNRVMAQAPVTAGTRKVARPIGEITSKKANKEAIERLRQMSPEEIEALDKKLAQALTLYYDRKFGQALPIFKEIADKVETMDIMFWIGTSAMKVGQVELAIEKFQKMLAIDPTLHRVRLELAVAYFMAGEYEKSRQQLELVQKVSPPPAVQKNINKLMAAINERTRKVFWNLRFSQGFLWDDNVSSGPDQRELAVLGGTLVLNKESQKLRDEAMVSNLLGNVLFDVGQRNGLMWNTTGSFYYRAYTDYHKFNYVAADLSTGPWWVGRRDIAKVPLGFTRRDFGSEKLSYTIHLDPNYEHFFTRHFSLRAFFSFSSENYFAQRNDPLDNYNYRYELSPNLYLANRKYIISLSLGIENHNAEAGRFSYEAPYVGLACFARLPTMTELSFRYQYARRDYDGRPLFYAIDRTDRRRQIALVLSQSFFKRFFASFSFSYLNNDSNAGLYDFDRKTYSLNVGFRL